MIYKNGYLTVYKNGTYYNTKSVGEINIPQSGSSFQIGNVNYYGSIDNVRYFNAAMNYSQIKKSYIAGLDSLLSKNLILKESYNQRIEVLSQI